MRSINSSCLIVIDVVEPPHFSVSKLLTAMIISFGITKVKWALRASSGKIYSGCNVENHGIQGICSERVAFVKAISEGEKSFEHIVVCGGSSDKLDDCLPCGYCRQFMSEFVNSEFKIYIVNNQTGKSIGYTLGELLPKNFQLE